MLFMTDDRIAAAKPVPTVATHGPCPASQTSPFANSCRHLCRRGGAPAARQPKRDHPDPQGADRRPLADRPRAGTGDGRHRHPERCGDEVGEQQHAEQRERRPEHFVTAPFGVPVSAVTCAGAAVLLLLANRSGIIPTNTSGSRIASFGRSSASTG
jgi:hypothetical protein